MRTLIVFSILFLMLTEAATASASDAIGSAGDAVAVAIPVAAVAMAVAHQTDKEGIIQFAESYATAGAVTLGLKYSVHERRPDGSEHSFPSFHAASSFAAATFIEKRYGGIAGIAAYTAAAFVGWTRIETREHWVRDVVAGAAIGTASGLIFTKPYKGVVVSPVADGNYWGLAIAKSF